jgi:hypothetical protein
VLREPLQQLHKALLVFEGNEMSCRFGKRLVATAATLSLFGAVERAHAQDIGAMSCIQVRMVMDNWQAHLEETTMILQYIHERFLADDDSWMANGHDAIAGRWTAAGVQQSIATDTATCENNRDETIAKHTDDVFAGLASLEIGLGDVQ